MSMENWGQWSGVELSTDAPLDNWVEHCDSRFTQDITQSKFVSLLRNKLHPRGEDSGYSGDNIFHSV